MKYCFNCNRITAGEPLFCNFCGCSYDLKLCSHKHSNPRNAMACSQCGSRDFSTPQPRVPFWARPLEFVLSLLPGLLLVLASVTAIGVALELLLQNPAALCSLAVPAAMLGVLWWAWSQIPRWFREAVYRLLRRRREGNDRRRP